jgi:hypothetical protein
MFVRALVRRQAEELCEQIAVSAVALDANISIHTSITSQRIEINHSGVQITCTPSYPASQHRYAVSPNRFTIYLISGIVNALYDPQISSNLSTQPMPVSAPPLPISPLQCRHSPRFRKVIPRPLLHQLHFTRTNRVQIQRLAALPSRWLSCAINILPCAFATLTNPLYFSTRPS